jgi:hypothetical protein
LSVRVNSALGFTITAQGRERDMFFALGGGEDISFSQRDRKRGVDGVMTWMKILSIHFC